MKLNLLSLKTVLVQNEHLNQPLQLQISFGFGFFCSEVRVYQLVVQNYAAHVEFILGFRQREVERARV